MTFFTALILIVLFILAVGLLYRGLKSHDVKLNEAHKNVVPFTGFFSRENREWGD